MKKIKCFYFILLWLFMLFGGEVAVSSEAALLRNIINNSSEIFIELGADNKNDTLIEGEEITFFLAANKDCQVILFRLTTNGELIVLFPNKAHPGFQVSSGVKYQVPGFNMEKIRAEGPGGTEIIKAVAVDDDVFFEGLDPAGEDDYLKIKTPLNFLSDFQKKLNNISVHKWATAEIEISVEEKLSLSDTAVPCTDPEIDNLLDFDYSDKFYAQGMSYYEQGRFDKAIEQFRKVVETSPNLAFGYYALGLSYQAKGDFSDAIDYYKLCLNQGIKERDCYVRVGEIYDQLGNKKESYLRYKKSLSITEGFENINSVYVTDTGDGRIYDLETGCLKNPDSKNSRMELAAIYEELGDYRWANYHVKKLLAQAIPLYEPCLLENDKPPTPKKPVVITQPVYVEPVYQEPYYEPVYTEPVYTEPDYSEPEFYTYDEPYPSSYTPPPPPPAEASPPDFIIQD